MLFSNVINGNITKKEIFLKKEVVQLICSQKEGTTAAKTASSLLVAGKVEGLRQAIGIATGPILNLRATATDLTVRLPGLLRGGRSSTCQARKACNRRAALSLLSKETFAPGRVRNKASRTTWPCTVGSPKEVPARQNRHEPLPQPVLRERQEPGEERVQTISEKYAAWSQAQRHRRTGQENQPPRQDGQPLSARSPMRSVRSWHNGSMIPQHMTADYSRATGVIAAALSKSYSKRAERMWLRFLTYCGNSEVRLIEGVIAFVGSLHHTLPSTRLSYLALLMSKLSRMGVKLASEMQIKDLIRALHKLGLRAPKNKAKPIDLDLLREALEATEDEELRLTIELMLKTGARYGDVAKVRVGDITSVTENVVTWKQMEGKTILKEADQRSHRFAVDPTVAAVLIEKSNTAAHNWPLTKSSYQNVMNFLKSVDPEATTYSVRRAVTQEAAKRTTLADTAAFIGHRTPRTTTVYVDAAPIQDLNHQLELSRAITAPRRSGRLQARLAAAVTDSTSQAF